MSSLKFPSPAPRPAAPDKRLLPEMTAAVPAAALTRCAKDVGYAAKALTNDGLIGMVLPAMLCCRCSEASK